MSPDLALLSTLTGSNYPCLELILMVPKVFEPLKFDCISKSTASFCKKMQETFAVSHFLAKNIMIIILHFPQNMSFFLYIFQNAHKVRESLHVTNDNKLNQNRVALTPFSLLIKL